MFFTQPHYNQILEILSSYKNHTATAKEIHKALNQFADISLVHTYNSLRSLIHLHVLTKQGQAYTINHRRIDRILQFAQKNKQQENMTQQRASLCDLNDEEHILVKANSLFVLDSTRSDAFAQICKKENPQEIYFYSSFAYHIL